MKFKIRNYRKISHADIEVNSITCVAGKGMAGKSSALGAISSIMTGLTNPYGDIKKKHMSRMVHSGTSSGKIELKDDETDLSAEIIWPDCKYSASSNHKLISPIVAGFKSIIDLNSPDRVKYIIEMMKALPTDSDLIVEMKGAGIYKKDCTVGAQKSFQKLWENITINGWDVAYQHIRDRWTKLKGQWELITGLNYGSKIVDEYEPDNFTEDLIKIKREKLVKDKDQAQEWCDAASNDIVLSDAEKTRLEKLVKKLPALEKEKKSLTQQEKIAQQSINDLVEKKRTAEHRGLTCPKCKAKLTLTNGTLKTIPEDDDSKPFDYDSGIKSLRLKQNMVLQKFGENKRNIEEAEKAKTQLDKIKKSDDSEKKNLDDVSEKLAICLDRLEMFDKYHQAHDIAKKITNNKKVIDILSPKGLRLTVLQNRLKMLNNVLKRLCDIAGWDLVEFDDNCDIKANGVPYHEVFLSRSEQYRVKLLLQIVCAMGEYNIDKNKGRFIILDNVDILMKTERNQLLLLLKHLANNKVNKYKFIIGVAYDNKQEMPDFSKFNIGDKENPVKTCKSYWIEDGVVV